MKLKKNEKGNQYLASKCEDIDNCNSHKKRNKYIKLGIELVC